MIQAFLQEISFSSAIFFAALLGLIPLYLAIGQSFLSRSRGERAKSILTGVAFGAMVFFILDLFVGASTLGLDFGTRSFQFRVALIGSFSLGLLIPAVLEPSIGLEKNADAGYHRLAYLFALAMGFHAFAEGVVIGYDVTAGFGFSLAQRAIQTISFVLHKGGEGFAVSIPLMFTTSSRIRRTVIVCGLIAGGPLVLGTAAGFLGLSGISASFSFAAGAGGLSYVLFRLARIPIESSTNRIFFFGLLLGVLYMYFAGSIHAIDI